MCVGASKTLIRHWQLELTIGNSVRDLPDSKKDEIGDELAHFHECQQRETEPQTEHSAKIRYVLDQLYTICKM